jgi:MFS family permease
MDQLSTLKVETEQNLNVSSAKFGMLFAIMSFVNAFMAPIGGFLMDKFGLFTGLYLASSSIFVGQFLLCIAAYLGSYNLMFFGRLVFGLGFEPINSVKNIIVA